MYNKRWKWILWAGTALVLGFSIPVFAQDQQVLSGPAQNWVSPLTFDPLAAKAEAAPGEMVRWLLKDTQINEQVDQTYSHEALQILTSGGVQEASEISIDFDPSCEVVTFHWVRILRNGLVLERFSPSKVRVLQRETELENHLFSGEETAVLVVDDVRTGDIIDYAYTITGANPSMRGRWSGDVPVQLSMPVARLRTRLMWPAQKHLYSKSYLTDARPQMGRKGDLLEFVWDFKGVAGLQVEPNTPDWYDPFPKVELSEYRQWSDVNQWAMTLFTNVEPLSPDLQNQILEWKKLKDHNTETLAALKFLQDEIRYLGMESGVNAYTPAPPSAVFERRYGDCKDKTLLLVTVLRALGIPSAPVLVNTVAQRTVNDLQPSSADFDHAIVQANVDNQIYYLDPTATYQRGPLSERFNPDYGYGLIVRPGTTQLTPIPASGGRPLTTVTEYLNLGAPPNSSTLKVVTVSSGEDAAIVRARYATTSREQIDRENLDFFAKLYPQITQTAPSTYADDEAGNQVETDQYYRVDNDWTPPPPGSVYYTFQIYTHNVSHAVRLPGISGRVMPLGVAYPRHEIFRLEATLPPTTDISNDQKTIENPSFYFHRYITINGNQLTLDYEYNALADYAPVDGVGQYINQLGQASDLLGYTLESYPRLTQ